MISFSTNMKVIHKRMYGRVEKCTQGCGGET